MSSARQYGLTVVGTSGGQELILCPWHHDSKPSAWFDPRKELFWCSVCGLGLNSWQLAKRMGIAVEEVAFGEENGEPEDYNLLEDEFDTATMLGVNMLHPYFEERGIDPVVQSHYSLRWHVQAEAAVMPITNLSGKAIGACYRYANPEISGTRYRKFGEQTPIWPMHHLWDKQPTAGLIVCEGAFSAMKLCSYAYRTKGVFVNCVALLGAKANGQIIDVLRPFQCIFLYDKDRAGINACKRMRFLNPLDKSYTLPVAPDDMTDDELEELLVKLGKVHKAQLGKDVEYA